MGSELGLQDVQEPLHRVRGQAAGAVVVLDRAIESDGGTIFAFHYLTLAGGADRMTR
jgi:hypothetical protein